MKQSGKLLRISDERSIFILENDDGSYVDQKGVIRYRNIGHDFEKKIVEESYTSIDREKGMINVLNALGKTKFFFPLAWLDTSYMRYLTLIESGVLKQE